ncbi:MAG: hypothetical protein L6U99_05950 [Clostridium sp.]|nr:MAG: hypothetical protein L6U99_05950 [Clostridium sp.]
MADILVDTISNEANIMLNIKIDCRFNESNHYFKMLYPYLNNSTFNADEINKIIDDILMQDIYTRLLFIQAIDLINPFEMVYNSYMRNTLDESKSIE